MDTNNMPNNIENTVLANIDTSDSAESLVRKSRNATNYIYTNQFGEQLSFYARKILTFGFMQVKREDNQFYDFAVDINKLAEAINVDPKNLKKKLNLKRETGRNVEDVLNELFHSTMSFQQMGDNEEENVKTSVLHIMSCATFINKKAYFRFNEDMRRILLELGNANNPYFGFIAKESLSLNSVAAMDLFEMIENELTLLEYKTTTNTKWKEIKLSIKQIRKVTFTENKYPNTNNFNLFVRRCCEDISEKTNTEIDLDSIKTDFLGKQATMIIMNVRHKKVPLVKNNNKQLLDSNKIYECYDDKELNKAFNTFLKNLNIVIDQDAIDLWMKRLKQCVDDSLGVKEKEMNIDIALRILERSERKHYKDLYGLDAREMERISSNEQRQKEYRRKQEMHKKFKELEEYYQNKNYDNDNDELLQQIEDKALRKENSSFDD